MIQNIKKLFPVIFIVSLMVSVSAYNGWGYGYWRSPLDFLENEWVRFAAVFILFFAIVFFAISRTFKEHIGAAIAVAVAVSFFITVAIARRGLLYAYAGDEIGNYLFIFAIILGAILLIKVITSLIGGIGLFLGLFGIWFFFNKMQYSDFIYEALPYEFFSTFEFLSGNTFLTLLIIAFIAILVIAYSSNRDINKKLREWLWSPKKEKKPIWPWYE